MTTKHGGQLNTVDKWAKWTIEHNVQLNSGQLKILNK